VKMNGLIAKKSNFIDRGILNNKEKKKLIEHYRRLYSAILTMR
jgi:hypothetical protein